jgi:rubrerythrin
MDISIFLAHTVKIELETEEAYLELAELMADRGNHDVSAFFSEMAGYSRLHRDVAMRRAGFDDLTDIHGIIDSWPESKTETEIPKLNNLETSIDLEDAMALSLAAEKRAAVFYEGVAQATIDTPIRLLAEEFASEERGHVLALERFFGQEPY